MNIRKTVVHPAFVVLAVTFLALLVSAGVRSAPAVLIFPFELHFGWSRAAVSLGAAMGILLYGLTAPFAAALMHQVGIRRTMLAGLALMTLSSFASLWMHDYWQFLVTWGMLSGIGTGAVASVLGAAIVNRWFKARRGLAMGLLGASTATGSLAIVPVLAWLSTDGNWKPVVLFVTICCAALIPVVALLVPEAPRNRGVMRFGETAEPSDMPRAVREPWMAFAVLRRSAVRPTFWLLAGSFFVCGLTTNGLVGTHMIAYCGDHGIAPVAAGGLLAAMGLFDLVGTTGSGWLTDRYNPRYLLALYYGVRGASLVMLTFIDFAAPGLAIFALLYGLNWIATLPPTVKIANEEFGDADGPVVYGWVQVAHQLGAASAAYGAGVARQITGQYDAAFAAGGLLALLTMLVMHISARRLRGIPAKA